MHRGREAREKGEGVHFDADRAIPEGFLQLDGDQPVVGEADVPLGDGGPEHVLEKVGSAHVVFCADAGRSMERESTVLDAQGAHELGKGRLSVLEVVGEKAGLPLGTWRNDL
jgi:hypothetical protein